MSEPLAERAGGARGPEVPGFSFVQAVTPTPDDVDHQGHLNNAAIARIFNDLRVAYILAGPGRPWRRYLKQEGLLVVVRELHIRYDREASLDDALLGAVRVTQRRGIAKIVEERLVFAADGASVAQGWAVQLLVKDGRAVPFPDFYWDAVAEMQGAPVPVVDPAPPRPPWGPPE